MATSEKTVVRLAAWLHGRLPHLDPASDHVDWFYVGLIAVPPLVAAASICLALADHTLHVSILSPSAPPPPTIKGYAIRHSLADRRLLIFGLVAAAYPIVLWVLVRLFTSRIPARNVDRHTGRERACGREVG